MQYESVSLLLTKFADRYDTYLSFEIVILNEEQKTVLELDPFKIDDILINLKGFNLSPLRNGTTSLFFYILENKLKEYGGFEKLSSKMFEKWNEIKKEIEDGKT